MRGSPRTTTPPRALVLDLEGVNFIDSQGAAKLAEIHELRPTASTLRLARVKPQVLAVLEADGFLERLGADHIHGNVHRAVEAQLAARGATGSGASLAAACTSAASSLVPRRPRSLHPALRLRHRGRHPTGHLLRVDHDQAGVALVEDLAQRLEVAAAHPSPVWPAIAPSAAPAPPPAASAPMIPTIGNSDTTAPVASPQPSPDRAVPHRLVVPAHDVDLARCVLRDHGRIEGVRGGDMAPGGFDGPVLGERVVDRRHRTRPTRTASRACAPSPIAGCQPPRGRARGGRRDSAMRRACRSSLSSSSRAEPTVVSIRRHVPQSPHRTSSRTSISLTSVALERVHRVGGARAGSA